MFRCYHHHQGACNLILLKLRLLKLFVKTVLTNVTFIKTVY